jgi:hypothetical protein
MTLLFDDALFPLTSTIGFVRAAAPKAVDSYLRWRVPLRRAAGRTVTAESIESTEGGLRQALSHLVPLRRGEPSRMLFAPTAGHWTAYFDNLVSGPDVIPIIRYLAIELNCLAVRFTAIPHTYRGTGAAATGRYGASILEIIDPIHGPPPLRTLRSIAAMNDGGRWRFDAVGRQQPFETTQPYQNRRVRERFQFPLLRDYLAALGLDAFNPDFYLAGQPATLVTEQFPDDSDDKYVTLGEWQNGRR